MDFEDLPAHLQDQLRSYYSSAWPRGIRNTAEVRRFWNENHGARGFLNIKEISPASVTKIRQLVETADRSS